MIPILEMSSNVQKETPGQTGLSPSQLDREVKQLTSNLMELEHHKLDSQGRISVE